MSTMGMATVGRTVVLVHAPGAIQESDWSRFLSRMRERDYDGLIIWAPRAAPNSRQRKGIRETWGSQLPQVSVMTESTAVRGVISALSLFLDDHIRGFQTSHLDAALEHVETPRELQGQVRDAVLQLRASIPELGDRAYFAALRRDHQQALEDAAAALCRNPANRDDLVQDTFESAFHHSETLKRVANPRASAEGCAPPSIRQPSSTANPGGLGRHRPLRAPAGGGDPGARARLGLAFTGRRLARFGSAGSRPSPGLRALRAGGRLVPRHRRARGYLHQHRGLANQPQSGPASKAPVEPAPPPKPLNQQPFLGACAVPTGRAGRNPAALVKGMAPERRVSKPTAGV